ncbi:MAG TPA: UDP-N-acetylmuramoyl-L-alanine--D-glutamate ligase [Myxococcota bacterium]|nr:UDP-N-acetylmuramoyl-L-alanine--D-glutamate ligase [Myxococcota bacterium]HPV04371.1 UDP-N-acetylmuramoyl-L-alanine--D-glutamate ligase [Myxococcota bacterium]
MLVEGRKFCVIGMGKSGIAASNLLASHGAQVVLSDMRDNRDLRESVAGSVDRRVETVFGCEVVRPGSVAVLSPGIAPHAPAFRLAQRVADEVIGEVELFFRFFPGRTIAVTGTDGKSTVTTLTAHLLNACGIPARAAGNLGNALCGEVQDLTEKDVVVAEVSCFQLITCRQFRPDVALVTNLAPDHIDHHGTWEAYVRAKAMVGAAQMAGDAFVRNIDDPVLKTWFTPGNRWISGNGQAVVDVSLEHSVEDGAFLEDGGLWIASRKRAIEVCRRDELKLPGPHNTENALMAIAACMALQDRRVSIPSLVNGLRTYAGLPHRIEFVRHLDGVDWYNDSKATNPHAAAVGIRSFAGRPLVLLAGGYEKNLELKDMATAIGERCRHVVLFGACAERMKREFPKAVPLEIVQDMRSAVNRAREIADPDSVVLLSPGASSFDQFTSFEDRGDRFKKMINEM